MKKKIILFFTFLLCAVLSAQYNTNVGSGGITVTPKGISFKNNPMYVPARSSSSIVFESKSIELPLDKAKDILLSTNLITGATLGSVNEVSQQSVAFASILYYPNKTSALLAFGEIFNFSNTIEGKVYALMGLNYLEGREKFNDAAKNLNLSTELNVLIKNKLHKVTLEKFFDAFFKDTSVFIPSQSILKRSSNIQINPAPIIIPRPRAPVIIYNKPKE